MVIAYHLIWTDYGWWLPNDPRGSTSHEIRVEAIARLGELHYGRKDIQPLSAELRAFYQQAQEHLKHPLLTFTDDELLLIAESVGQVIADRRYTCYACALMPDHVHLLMRAHRDKAEGMLRAFQDEARTALVQAGKRDQTHPVSGGPGWKVFLNSHDDLKRLVAYIRNNPIKARRPAQSWPIVRPIIRS
jgi:REP element-mobilizing transposase RayT